MCRQTSTMAQDDVGHSPVVNATAGKETFPANLTFVLLHFSFQSCSQFGPCRTMLLSIMSLKDPPSFDS